MKEVERFSLGGYAFTLEQDAASLVGDYLGELEKYYNGREGGSDIMEGIEERMAELLLEKAGREGVCTREMIEQIIGILGKPEIIEAAGEEDAPGQARDDYKGARDNKNKRKLYRDMNDRIVAGVCSGIAAYLDTDPAIFRLLFALLTVASMFGWRWTGGHAGVTLHFAVPVLYLILWICMPAAKTVRQRWEQRGEDGTLSGIQRSIENGAREIDDAIQSVSRNETVNQVGNVLLKLFGIVLLIVAFSVLFTGGLVTFGSGIFGGKVSFFGLGDLFEQGMTELRSVAPSVAATLVNPWIHVLSAVVIFLPFIWLLYAALQLIFGFKSPRWHPGLVMIVLWILCLLALAILVTTGVLTTEFLTV